MNVIETKEELQMAFALSYDTRILIFKLSNVCPLSQILYKKLKEMISEEASIANQVYLLVVQISKELSNEIALKFGVVHETPQILVIENEDVVFYESHEKINLDKVVSILKGLS
jgi:bacillithiol system protein YtxJ